ncbi:lysine exporter LysO family protein [Collinsella sp. An2]|uniref:lysine exporter LysO family protein n=1 Tax=Collinsella sp. An2 TaxID=1965585 RepID=UPI001952065C|nr:lysine exporter LysO family protein [Collinsella sp. An2]
MDILIVMLVGAAAGRLVVPAALKRPIETLQVVCTCLLIFTMGVSLGCNDDFFRQLGAWGVQSLVFCLIPMVFSVAVVYALTSWLMGDGRARDARSAATGSEGASSGIAPDTSEETSRVVGGGETHRLSLGARIVAFLKDESMVVLAFAALLLGIGAGVVAGENALLASFVDASDLILDVLMLLVGMSVGMHRGLVKSIREHHIKTLVIPLGVVVGSVAGGLVAALLLGYLPREGMAVASGLGWYSLVGVTIEGLAGAQLGAIAFLANLMRELFSFFSIPVIARRLNYYSCIAAAAATSEDTTLPMMIKYTDERTVVFSLVNGIICSACVPVLVSLFLA